MQTLATIIADFNTQLSSSILVGDTSAHFETLVDDDGVALPEGRYFFTIDGGNSLKEHFSADLDDGVMTNLKSVSRQGVETTGAVRPHRVGASVTMVNFAHIRYLSELLSGGLDLNSLDPLKYASAPTINNDAHVATKAEADAASIGSTIDATTTDKGHSKVSVAPADASNPIVVGTNDPRMPTADENDAMDGTGTPSAAAPFVTQDHSALVNNMVLSGAQDIAGIKTLTSIPVLPGSDPTTANQMARKSYVDALFA